MGLMTKTLRLATFSLLTFTTMNARAQSTTVYEYDGAGNQMLEYNPFGELSRLEEDDHVLTLGYGAEGRSSSVLTKDWKTVRSVSYYDNVDVVTDSLGVKRSFFYLGKGLLAVTDKEKTGLYYLCTDNLGSIIKIVDEDGQIMFDSDYDVWGRQNVKTDSLGFIRGYTGHEMLPVFRLINMNGRVYDPIIGRFLSPDNNIQMPYNSQNFNRYSYCMNNPLKYVDPDGEFILFPFVALVEFVGNVVNHGLNVSSYSWKYTKNAWNIDKGMFKGNVFQIFGKWTWELPNSLVGNLVSHGYNIAGQVDKVTYLDGMAALAGATNGNSAVTIGHYFLGTDN